MNPDSPASNNPPLFRFRGIEKRFFGVCVLKAVSFDVRAASITGLVGENGAGKSTLMNLLGGNLPPDAGEMFLDGHPHKPLSPADARRAGVAFVHQELNLFPNLSVAENLLLTSFPLLGRIRGGDAAASGTRDETSRTPFCGEAPPPRRLVSLIDRRALLNAAGALLARVGLEVAPRTPLERLSAGERQLVEIARALGTRARVLILDEPTTSLTNREAARLFELMRKLRGDGLALIFISHSLGDVLREADDIVVLRDGELVGSGAASNFDTGRLVSLMVGRELGQLFPTRAKWRPPDHAGLQQQQQQRAGDTPASRQAATARAEDKEPLLVVSGVSQEGVVRDISFRLQRGEILGLSGLMGAGRSELARILFGLDPCKRGTITVAGQTLVGAPRRRIRHGLAFLTEDRRADGLCLKASIADNMALVTLREHARNPVRWLDLSGVRNAVKAMREAVRLTPAARDDQPVETLSGGNQQKVVLAKWLLARPALLILDEPTRGIDVGVKFEIYRLIHRLADDGAGVLVISSELEELLGLCDRILVMSQGRIRDDVPRPEFSQERILRAALPA